MSSSRRRNWTANGCCWTWTHSITKLNDMGGYIWSLLEEHPTIERLADKIVQEYDVKPERAASDVEAFVTHLVEVGLVTYG